MSILKIVISSVLIVSFSGCMSSLNPFKQNTFIVNEGYLSIGKINENIAKQMPLRQKVETNEIKIVNTKVYASHDQKSLIVESDFIFTSFEIPEGTPVIAKFKAGITYDPKTKEFHLSNLELIDIKFLKEELLEYVSPKQKRFIVDTLKYLLQEIILHKSVKQLRTIHSIEVKNGKIKVVFN
jgi:hypothetical protein